MFWKAVRLCEVECDLKVIATTCDGAPANRNFFLMHANFTDTDSDVVYKVKMFFSEDRYIYFISDAPHLIKTARNCLANSGSGRCTRYMWKDGLFILWNHIVRIFNEDGECGFTPYAKIII